LFGAQALPANAIGGRRFPRGGGLGRVLGIDLQKQLGSTPEGLGERPFAPLREGPDFLEQLLRDLNLCLGHAGNFNAPSNQCQDVPHGSSRCESVRVRRGAELRAA